jgi:preprotein translocase subunit Sec61beta
MNLDRADWKMIRIGAIYIVVAGIFIAVMLAVSS